MSQISEIEDHRDLASVNLPDAFTNTSAGAVFAKNFDSGISQDVYDRMPQRRDLAPFGWRRINFRQASLFQLVDEIASPDQSRRQPATTEVPAAFFLRFFNGLFSSQEEREMAVRFIKENRLIPGETALLYLGPFFTNPRDLQKANGIMARQTYKNRVSRLLQKLKVGSLLEAVVYSWDNGLFSDSLMKAFPQNLMALKVDQLTSRQIEILAELARGQSYKQIAGKVTNPIGLQTVKNHLWTIYRQLGCHNGLDAALAYKLYLRRLSLLLPTEQTLFRRQDAPTAA